MSRAAESQNQGAQAPLDCVENIAELGAGRASTCTPMMGQMTEMMRDGMMR